MTAAAITYYCSVSMRGMLLIVCADTQWCQLHTELHVVHYTDKEQRDAETFWSNRQAGGQRHP